MIHSMFCSGGRGVWLALGAALTFALLTLGGCSSYHAPTLRVAAATIGDQSPQGTVINFTLDAENSNAVELPLREVRYTLELEGRPVFEGFRSPEATIRRFAVQRVTLPAVVTADDAARVGLNASGGAIRYRMAGTLTYITPGEIEEILFDNEIRRPTVSFAEEGVVGVAAPISPTAPAPEAR